MEEFDDLLVVVDEDIDNQALSTNDKVTVEDPLVKWVFQMQASSGLLASTENSDFTSLYDHALAALLFIKKNKKQRKFLIFLRHKYKVSFKKLVVFPI